MNFNTFIEYVSPLSFAMILGVDNRGAIGFKNDLPWKGHISNKSDMQWFRDKTKGKIIIMGYNTWVSLGRKPLPGRVNIVVSNKHRDEVKEDINRFISTFKANIDNKEKQPPTILLTPNPEVTVETIKAGLNNFHRGGEVMIIGGAKIYEAFLPYTSRIYLTTFDGEFEADAFVKLDLDKWELCYRDAMDCTGPKFEIWDCTEEAAQRPDSEMLQISHEYQPAAGIALEVQQQCEKEKNV